MFEIGFYLTALAAAALTLWNRRLRREVQRRAAAQAQLEQSETRYRALFDIAPIFIDAFDAQGRCLIWNRECERVFGWSIEEINACENPVALFYPDPKDQQIMIDACTTARDTHFLEQRPMTRSGRQITSLWANVNLPNGELVYVGIDMTEQRETERKLLEAQRELRELNASLERRVAEGIAENRKKEKLLIQQSRLAQMGEMLSMIAHQWRQPLSVIDLGAFGIQSALDTGKFDLENRASREAFAAFLHRELEDIHHYSEYLTNTIEDFRNYFKPDKEREVTTLNVPVEKALSMLDPSIKQAGVTVTTTVQTHAAVAMHTHEVMQVVLNILKNSLDNFNEKKSADPAIAVEIFETAQAFGIKIRDNGGGIDTAILPRIFDPYFSTKDDKNGTGLGLYMSKMLIENHSRGELNVANVDGGVCFEILLLKEPAA